MAKGSKAVETFSKIALQIAKVGGSRDILNRTKKGKMDKKLIKLLSKVK